MLGVDLDGYRRIEPAHVGWPVGLDGSRRIQKDRLDDHRDDQGPSDTESDATSIRPGFPLTPNPPEPPEDAGSYEPDYPEPDSEPYEPDDPGYP